MYWSYSHQGLNSHAEKLAGKLRKEFESSVDELRKAASQENSSAGIATFDLLCNLIHRVTDEKHMHVDMDVTSGPYAGKKFSVCPGKVRT